MKMSIYSVLLFISMSSFFMGTGCGGNNSDDADPGSFTPVGNTVSLSLTAGGDSWEAEEMLAYSQNVSAGWQYNVQGKDAAGNHFTLVLQNTDNTPIVVGTYPLGGASSQFQSIIWTTPSTTHILKPDALVDGQITIDQMDANRTSGSFSVNLYDNLMDPTIIPIQLVGTYETNNYTNYN